MTFQEVKLGIVAKEITVGHVGSMATEYVKTGVPFLRSLNIQPFRISTSDLKFISSDFHRRLKKSALRPGDVVIVRTGKPGTCAVVPEWLADANCSDLVIVRCGPDLLPRYLAYWVNSLASHHIGSSLVGAVQQHFNVGAAREMPLFLPDRNEQDRILGVLTPLDDKIELNRRVNETLEGMAQAIFKDWFVDFGPTRRKLAGIADPIAVMGGLTPDAARATELAALFPDALGDDGLPVAWIMTTLEDAVSVLETGSRPKGGIKGIDSGVPSIGAENIFGLAKYDFSKTKYVTRDFFNSMRRGILGERDVLVYKDGGRPGEFEPHIAMFGNGFPYSECCINEHVYRIVSKKPFSQEYLYLHLSSEATSEEMRNKGTGVAIPGLNSTAVKSLTILRPASKVLNEFSKVMRPIFDRALCGATESCALAETRDYLLPKLMSGEVRVRDAEKLAESAPA